MRVRRVFAPYPTCRFTYNMIVGSHDEELDLVAVEAAYA